MHKSALKQSIAENDTGSVPPETHLLSGRSGGDVERQERDHEAREVREHVRRVCEDRQRVRQNAADRLHHHEYQTEEGRDEQLSAGPLCAR